MTARRVLLLIVVLLAAPAVFAQAITVQVQPASPTALTPVTLVVQEALCGEVTGVVRDGSTIDLVYEEGGCVLPIPMTQSFGLGILPPGTYVVRLAPMNEAPSVLMTFAVAEVPQAPTLEWWAALVLASLLALIALRRGL